MVTPAPTPLVSIAMTTYNGGKFLAGQIDSILNQTYTNIELVISDDGSTDNTRSICEAYAAKDPRVKFSTSPSNLGFKKNFERAVRLCTGEIFFFSDQDDIWYPEKIAEHVKVYSDPTVIWAYNEVRLMDENNEKVLGYETDRIPNYYAPVSLFKMIGGRCILGCATSYRKSATDKIWPLSEFAPAHDSFTQLSLYPSKSIHIQKVLQDYRQHANTVTHDLQTGKVDIGSNVRKNINYVKDLCRRRNFPIWKRIYFFAIYCLKNVKYQILHAIGKR